MKFPLFKSSGRRGREASKDIVVTFTDTILYSPFVPPDWGSIVLYWKTNKQNENLRKLLSTATCIAIGK